MPACNGGSGTDSGSTDESGSTSSASTITVTAEDSSSSITTVDPSESGTTETTITTSPDSSDSGDPECGVGAMCGAEPPVGWFGPVVHARFPEGAEPPPCPEQYPDPGPTLLAGFNDPGPAICGCECDLSQMANCYSQIYTHSNMQCYDWLDYSMVTESCLNMTLSGFVDFNSNGYGAGFCEETETEVITPLTWETAIRTCRLETPIACTEGVCTPTPPDGFEDAWCIYQQGDLDCPAGPFSEKEQLWTAAEDTRDCSNCTCGTAGTSCTDHQLLVFAGLDCAGEPTATIDANVACQSITGQSVAGDFGSGAACPVTEPSVPEGTVTAMGAFTLCCQPG